MWWFFACFVCVFLLLLLFSKVCYIDFWCHLWAKSLELSPVNLCLFDRDEREDIFTNLCPFFQANMGRAEIFSCIPFFSIVFNSKYSIFQNGILWDGLYCYPSGITLIKKQRSLGFSQTDVPPSPHHQSPPALQNHCLLILKQTGSSTHPLKCL